ncbi:MAG: GtrA family protein [Bacilli bacterium]|nr:GtrA family protein [Bacilli bacterium]
MKKLYYKYEEIINYLIFGILTTIISVITYLFFANIIFSIKNDLTIQISNVLSWICAVTFAYITNRKYVFKSKIKGKKQIKEAMNFFLSRIFSLIVDMLMMYILFSIIHMDDTIAKLLVQIVVVILNYLLSKIIVFKKNNNKEI